MLLYLVIKLLITGFKLHKIIKSGNKKANFCQSKSGKDTLSSELALFFEKIRSGECLLTYHEFNLEENLSAKNEFR